MFNKVLTYLLTYFQFAPLRSPLRSPLRQYRLGLKYPELTLGKL